MEWKDRSAYLLLKTQPGHSEKVWRSLQNWRQGIGAWVVTGPWDVMAWVDSNSWNEVYELVASLRRNHAISATSSHWVHEGWKNAGWWWEWPSGAWVLWRDSALNGHGKKSLQWKWATSSASIPGDWDWITWVGGKDWSQVWTNVMEFQKSGWQTETLVPVRSWWNKKWSKEWWG